ERIEHDDLAVNVHACAKDFGAPVVKGVLDVLGHHRLKAEVLRRLRAAIEQRHRSGSCRIEGGVCRRLASGVGGQVDDLLVHDAADIETGVEVGGALVVSK